MDLCLSLRAYAQQCVSVWLRCVCARVRYSMYEIIFHLFFHFVLFSHIWCARASQGKGCALSVCEYVTNTSAALHTRILISCAAVCNKHAYLSHNSITFREQKTFKKEKLCLAVRPQMFHTCLLAHTQEFFSRGRNFRMCLFLLRLRLPARRVTNNPFPASSSLLIIFYVLPWDFDLQRKNFPFYFVHIRV